MSLSHEVTEYIKSKGFSFRETGDELNLKVCPFCLKDDFNHFYINKNTGQYTCHHGECNAKGSFFTLKKFLGDLIPIKSFDDIVPMEEVFKEDVEVEYDIDKAHETLKNDKGALKWLAERRFSPLAIDHFKLGMNVLNGVKWLWYPYIYQGKLKNIKMRTLPPADKGFRRVKGAESCLFNEDVMDLNYDDIILTEGESDCIALWTQGWNNVVGVTLGSKGVNPKWIDKFDKYKRVYFVYDTDIAGKTGAYRFAQRLGIERCFLINLPNDIKDVNDYFKKGHSADEFAGLVKSAIPFDVESVKSLGSILQETYLKFWNKEEGETGLVFPWPTVARLAGKMEPGDLWVIASKPKVGKTTFVFNLLYHFTSIGIPSLLFELEMRPERMLPRIVSLHLRKEDTSSHEDLYKAYTDMRDYPFYFAYGYRKLDWDTISDTIRMSIRRYGIRFVAFDNLHFLCRSKDHMVQEISIMTQNFKLLAEELAIPILVIARPRKTGGKEMIAEDLMWSADIEADADGIIILSRKEKSMAGVGIQEGVFEPETIVRVNRVRYTAGGAVTIKCIDREARFTEMTL